MRAIADIGEMTIGKCSWCCEEGQVVEVEFLDKSFSGLLCKKHVMEAVAVRSNLPKKKKNAPGKRESAEKAPGNTIGNATLKPIEKTESGCDVTLGPPKGKETNGAQAVASG